MRAPAAAVLAIAQATMRAKPMTFSTALRMKSGENTLSVAIVDQISGVQGFARTTVLAQ